MWPNKVVNVRTYTQLPHASYAIVANANDGFNGIEWSVKFAQFERKHNRNAAYKSFIDKLNCQTLSLCMAAIVVAGAKVSYSKTQLRGI